MSFAGSKRDHEGKVVEAPVSHLSLTSSISPKSDSAKTSEKLSLSDKLRYLPDMTDCILAVTSQLSLSGVFPYTPRPDPKYQKSAKLRVLEGILGKSLDILLTLYLSSEMMELIRTGYFSVGGEVLLWLMGHFPSLGEVVNMRNTSIDLYPTRLFSESDYSIYNYGVKLMGGKSINMLRTGTRASKLIVKIKDCSNSNRLPKKLAVHQTDVVSAMKECRFGFETVYFTQGSLYIYNVGDFRKRSTYLTNGASGSNTAYETRIQRGYKLERHSKPPYEMGHVDALEIDDDHEKQVYCMVRHRKSMSEHMDIGAKNLLAADFTPTFSDSSLDCWDLKSNSVSGHANESADEAYTYISAGAPTPCVRSPLKTAVLGHL